jgi:transcription elongation factor GreB
VSPVAKALLKAEIGDVVTIRTPAGPEELEVIAVRYTHA